MKLRCVFLILPVVLCGAVCCSTQKKVSRLHAAEMAPDLLRGPDEAVLPVLDNPEIARDTLTVTGEDGREVYLMKAVRDENGEMVASDVIDAAVISARFTNVAERLGMVSLSFRVRVPAAMRDSRWQLCLWPLLAVMGDTLALEHVTVTGQAYRKAQLRGYQQYRRFLARIVTDTASFIRMRDLEIFLRRNIPEVYAFRTDSSFVSDEQFESSFGVTAAQALDHYTDHLAKSLNSWRIARKDKMFRRYVPNPIAESGVRLDTVMVSDDGDFIYDYVQPLHTRPGLRKAEILLGGEILEQDRRIYSIPQAPPLTFYISSLSALADDRERYLLKIVERRAEAHTACYVAFDAGSAVVDPGLGNNAEEIGRIKDNISELLESEVFEIDSIVVRSSASPEGNLRSNELLSLERSRSISNYMDAFIREVSDSLGGIGIDAEGRVFRRSEAREIHFVSRSEGENWPMLDRLVSADTVLTGEQKAAYFSLASMKNADSREREMSRAPSYPYMRGKLYPRLRTVKFDFHLHRRDMVKDTVHTTVPDTVYRRGLERLKDMDYAGALALLRPYSDYNTALAYMGLGRDASALDILEKLPESDKVEYLRAILCCRAGDLRSAVESYRRSCLLNPSFVHRGNLDPEISSLIRLYGLNN